MEYRVSDNELVFDKRPQTAKETGRSTWHASKSHTGRSRQTTVRVTGPGYVPLLGSMDEVLWMSLATAELVDSNQKKTEF